MRIVINREHHLPYLSGQPRHINLTLLGMILLAKEKKTYPVLEYETDDLHTFINGQFFGMMTDEGIIQRITEEI